MYGEGISLPPSPPNIIFNVISLSSTLNFHNCFLDAVVINVNGAGTLQGTMDGSNAAVSLGVPTQGNIILDGNSSLGFLSSSSANDAIQLQGHELSVGNLGLSSTIVGRIVDSLGFSGSQLTKTGLGTLVLSGSNSYSGPTTISNGRLNVNGTINSPAAGVVVNSGATLGGTGTITANIVTINGTLNPGNSIGTLNVVGPVTFNSSSNYLVEFDAAHCDLLNVTGSVTIDPGASVTLQADQMIANNTVYPIITVTSPPISGTFTSLNNPYLFLTAQLSYASVNQVLLLLSRNTFASVLPSNAPSNAIATGGALDQVNPLGGSDLDNIVGDLMLTTSLDVIIHDLLQMQPSQIKALGVSETNTTVQLHSIIAEHAGSYIKTACTIESRKKWSAWGDLFGVFSHQSMLHGELGFHDKTGGGLIGIDASPCKNLSVGGALSYTFTHLDWNHNPSHATVQNGYGIFYTSWYSKHFFVTSAATCGYNHNDVDRNILLFTSPINTTAHSSFSGVEGSGFMEIGAIATDQKAEFKPFVSLHYCYLHHNHFRERGADGLNLKVDDANANLLRSEAGLQFSSCYKRNEYEWIPRLTASVIEENRFKGKHYRTEFVENPGVFFTVKGLRPQHTLFSPKASIQLKKGENLSLFLGYEGEFGSKFHNNRAHLFVNRSF